MELEKRVSYEKEGLSDDIQQELPRIKKFVSDCYQYFEENYKRFYQFQNFTFKSTLSENECSALNMLGKPEIEVNIVEPYVSRLVGEFSKQEPSFLILNEGDDANADVVQVLQNYLRHIFFDSKASLIEYEVYREMLTGGYSVFKVWTEYASSMSFDQVIKIGKCYDPTLCFFDPMAQLRSKQDGRGCGEIFPISKEEFKQKYPNVNIDNISFTRNIEGFNWSYLNGKEKILLICYYYEKKKSIKKIVKLANGDVMFMKDYKEKLREWEKLGIVSVPPKIVGKPRYTEIETICRYVFIENEILEYTETDYKFFPYVFADGNSAIIKKTQNGSSVQMTRPYIYNTVGLQRLKNCAAQNLANELEMLVQHKFKVAKESLPDEADYLQSYSNVQKADTLVYNYFLDNDPNKQLPAPQEIVRPPIPPEILQSFNEADRTMQTVLGSYDASLGINNNELSGIAIVEGATQSNAAAMPYVVGYLQAWSTVANIILDLIPKYYKTSRTIPQVMPDGTRSYQVINNPNNPDAIDMYYDSNAFQVQVEAGPSFAVQKSRAIQEFVSISQAMPDFSAFMGSKGIKVLLDNMQARGIDQLKELYDEFLKEQTQMQAQQQQMQQQMMQSNPQILKAQNEHSKMLLESNQNQLENQLKAVELKLQEKELEIQKLKMLIQVDESKRDFASAISKTQAEDHRANVELALKIADIHKKHIQYNKENHNVQIDNNS